MLTICILQSVATSNYAGGINTQIELSEVEVEITTTPDQADFVFGMDEDEDLFKIPRRKQIVIKPRKPTSEVPEDVRWVNPENFSFWGFPTNQLLLCDMLAAANMS